MKKRISNKTTIEKLEESMTVQEREIYEEEYHDFLLSELLIAITNDNELSVRKLAEAADLSPRIVQAMRSGEDKDYSVKSFFKILTGLRCKKFTITTHQGKSINIPIPSIVKKN